MSRIGIAILLAALTITTSGNAWARQQESAERPIAGQSTTDVENEALNTEEDRQVLEVWPEGYLPPDAVSVSADRVAELKENETEERLTYVERATLTVYEAPADKANGCSVVICPGGGYNILAWPKEGLEGRRRVAFRSPAR